VTLITFGSNSARAETWAESLKRQAAEIVKKVEDAVQLSVPAQSVSPPNTSTAAQQIKPRFTRPPASLRTLMNRMVTGDELITELKAIQISMREQHAAKSMADFTNGLVKAAGQTANTGKFDLGGMLTNLGGKALESQLKAATVKIAYKALDDFLLALVQDPNLLQRETIQMPAANKMSDAQTQSVVTMAALVVTARATGKLLEQAEKDIADIEGDYKRLIERREQAAKILYEALGLRAQAQRDGNAKAVRNAEEQLGTTMSRTEMAFLDSDLSRMDASQFANDIAAQNLAIQFLRKKDPSAYAEYVVGRDGALKRTKGYILTAAGAAAIGGLTATFLRETSRVWESRDFGHFLTVLPFGAELLKESYPLIRLAAQATGGVILSANQSLMRFSVATATGEEKVRDANATFAILKAKQVDGLLADSLFRNGSAGLLQRVQVCDGAEAGRMIDKVIDVNEREQFATAWFGSEVPSEGFAFENAIGRLPEGASRREKELPDRLLKADYRGQRDDANVALGGLQERLSQRYASWNDEQLTRLIFSNREGAASMATLQLGEVSVRPNPSMESIYIYESLIESCKSLVPDATTGTTSPQRPSGKTTAAKPTTRQQ